MTRTTQSTIDRASSPDITLGAYLLTHMKSTCENCGTFETPQWRKGWYSDVLNRTVLLCNACGLKYHKNQFCPYCYHVYGKDQEKFMSSTFVNSIWAACQTCGRWVHKDCEMEYGEDKEVQTPGHHYHCPHCKTSAVNSLQHTPASSPIQMMPSPSHFHPAESKGHHHSHHHVKSEFRMPSSPRVQVNLDLLDQKINAELENRSAMETD